MKTLTKEYPLIPMSEITDEARQIAVAWMDCEDKRWIGQKHKLASDIMNYARQENARLTAINRLQAEYLAYLKRAIHSESIIDNITAGARDKYDKELQSLQAGEETKKPTAVEMVREAFKPIQRREEEPKHPTSWRDFTMTDVEPKCEECPSKQFYEANTAKIMDKIEQPERSVTDEEIDELVDKIWHTSNTDKHKVIVRDWLENGIASVTYEEIKPACKYYYFDCWGRTGASMTKTICASNKEDAELIFKGKYPDYAFDQPYTNE